jgi:hypothetical protein
MADEEMADEEMADDLKFYTKQIYLIIKPVVACIILSVLWVKIVQPVAGYWDTGCVRFRILPPIELAYLV